MNRLVVSLVGLFISFASVAQVGDGAIFGDVERDTLTINEMLRGLGRDLPMGKMTAQVARQFVGTPYAAGTLEGDTEQLRVNLQQMDCTTLVETVAAIVMTAHEGRISWRDFLYNLTSLRYRGGNINGYASRLHYFSDWALDNAYRGNLTEVSESMPGASRTVKSLDYMTRHRELYPALADSLQYARMRGVEDGYRNTSHYSIKATRAMSRNFEEALREGDIIAFTTSKQGLDVTHMGIIVMNDGQPRLLHASSRKGAVVIEEAPLKDYLHRNGSHGVRVVRLKP